LEDYINKKNIRVVVGTLGGGWNIGWWLKHIKGHICLVNQVRAVA